MLPISDRLSPNKTMPVKGIGLNASGDSADLNAGMVVVIFVGVLLVLIIGFVGFVLACDEGVCVCGGTAFVCAADGHPSLIKLQLVA